MKLFNRSINNGPRLRPILDTKEIDKFYKDLGLGGANKRIVAYSPVGFYRTQSTQGYIDFFYSVSFLWQVVTFFFVKKEIVKRTTRHILWFKVMKTSFNMWQELYSIWKLKTLNIFYCQYLTPGPPFTYRNHSSSTENDEILYYLSVESQFNKKRKGGSR